MQDLWDNCFLILGVSFSHKKKKNHLTKLEEKHIITQSQVRRQFSEGLICPDYDMQDCELSCTSVEKNARQEQMTTGHSQPAPKSELCPVLPRWAAFPPANVLTHETGLIATPRRIVKIK